MKGKFSEASPKTVDDYLKPLPSDIRDLLTAVRKVIKSAAPDAEEVISYQIPTYKLSGPLVHFAAFKDHCSLVFVSKNIPELFKKELGPFDVKGRTLHFSVENPLPSTLIKKIVKARVEENLDSGMRKGKATLTKKTKSKPASTKMAGNTEVKTYMDALKHPLKDTVESVRTIIRKASPGIEERIKWNAPSYHINNVDMVTFNLREEKRVHLVFHHPAIEEIQSPILEGNYKGRRMTYFNDMKDIKAGKRELQRIVRELVEKIKA